MPPCSGSTPWRSAQANTALEVLQLAQTASLPLGDLVATKARDAACAIVAPAQMGIDVVAVDRGGRIIGRSHGAAA